MAIFTRELVGWALVITLIILMLIFITAKFGPDSTLKDSLLSQIVP